MKLCPRCNTERPVEDFHRDKTKSSGRRSACKYCINNKITGKPKFKEDKFCVNCSTVLVKDQKKFCSHSCAATVNNSLKPKRAKIGNYDECPECKVHKKQKKSARCPECNRANRVKVTSSLKLLDVIQGKKHPGSVYNTVRHHARVAAAEFDQKCCICSYSKSVEVCHIKAIKDFDLETSIVEINGLNNLTLLCRNHHWELDHKLLDVGTRIISLSGEVLFL